MPSAICLLALDALCPVGMVAAIWMGLSVPARAYVDPSVMTYTIQALAGVAVALSAVLGVVWRRARRHLLRRLNIDESAGKVVEPDVRAVSADDPRRAELLAAASAQAAAERSLQGRRRGRALTWHERLALAATSCLALSLTLLVVAPLEVVVAGAGSLAFDVTNVWAPLLVAALAIGAVAALSLSAVRGRAFDVTLAVVCALGICALVQEVALNQGLPLADGTPVEWGRYGREALTSGIVWLVVIAGVVAVALARPAAARATAVLSAVVLVVAQGVGLGMLVSANAASLGRPVATREGLMEVSPKSNVVMFVLDTFDTRYMDEVLDKYSDAASELGGFTYFRNSVGSMIPTRYAVPFLVTGHELDTTKPGFTTDDLAQWFSEPGLLDVASARGYSVGVYSDSVGEGLEALAGKTMNVHGVAPYSADLVSCVRTLGACGLYRDLPWALKPAFWFTTDQLNEAVATTGGREAAETPYVMGDASYRASLDAQRLSASDGAEAGAYRVIHLQGSHSPYVMDENGETATLPQDEASMIAQSAGSLQVVADYIRQLKELGIYDQTTFVITADHGVWPWGNRRLPKATTPIVLVKPAGADTDVPLQVSEAPTGHADLPATLRAALGAEAGGPTVFDVTDDARTRYFYWTDHDGKIDYNLIEWRVDGDAQAFSSWRETGRSWPVDMAGYRAGDTVKKE